MGDLVDMRTRTRGSAAEHEIVARVVSNVATWGIGVEADGSMTLTIKARDGLQVLFLFDHELATPFENAVSIAARHSREITDDGA